MLGRTLVITDPFSLAVRIDIAVTDRHGSMASLDARKFCTAKSSNIGVVMARPLTGHEKTVVSLHLGAGTPSESARTCSTT